MPTKNVGTYAPPGSSTWVNKLAAKSLGLRMVAMLKVRRLYLD